ncbi:hypothetical protein BKP37_06425 [Anaerobacillus alkalilacustris]|uniref:Uncharacterized protein n=1 Tax=Anaerobacillus alkalilacustris TaxID=393763 RepID=A0A1S2LVJ5_9BACI|nr:hypothetical protein [Anaerobacillus alkalilacustris]OIJ16354.1 hypothetical protein BKP37_06425 [Anaerobacillus alkalilacustris]
MENYIHKQLDAIYNDFKSEIDQLDELCSLHDLRFNYGHLPNYFHSSIQQLYLLRYFPAYVFEYYRIFKKVIEFNHVDTPYKVLSIGVGSLLDYYGLELAMKEVGLNVQEYAYYTGVDKVDWMYKDSLGNHDCTFIAGDINQITPTILEEFNIIIFPKSIGEFPETAFQDLMSLLEKVNFSERKIVLISSIRDSQLTIDKDRFKNIVNLFGTSQGLSDLDPQTDYYYFKDHSIRDLNDYFTYPEHIRRFLINLQEQCKSYDPTSHLCVAECENYLNKSPILRTRLIKYQIKRLEEKEGV